MVLSIHSRTHLRRPFCRVGQTPRRALRVTRTVVEKLFDDSTIAARYTPAFGRPAEAGRRAGRGKTLRNADSCRGQAQSGKAARGPQTVSSGTEWADNSSILCFSVRGITQNMQK